MVRQGHLIAVVRAFLIGCVVLLLVVGCAGTRSETSKKEEQGSSPQATASEEEARCEGTGTYHLYEISYNRGGEGGPLRTGSEEDMKKAAKKAKQGWRWGVKTHDYGVYTTNDLPGCPKGGLLLGTDKADKLGGKVGDDEVRGLGGKDELWGGDGDDEVRGLGSADDLAGGPGNDILYGGPGDDEFEQRAGGGKGDEVIYGGDGNDFVDGGPGENILYGGDGNDRLWDGRTGTERDKLYCGKGKDRYYIVDKNDYVDSSCERPAQTAYGGGLEVR